MRSKLSLPIFALVLAAFGIACSGDKAARQIIRAHRAEYQRCEDLLASAKGGMAALENQRGDLAAFGRASSDVSGRLREAGACVAGLREQIAQAMVAKGVSHTTYEKAWAKRDEIFAEADQRLAAMPFTYAPCRREACGGSCSS